MLGRLFLGLLALSFAIMTILSYLCYSWLQSIGNPASVVKTYTFYSGISWTVLWILFIALIGFGNVLLWIERKAWALWLSLLFFVVFIVVQTFWLENVFYNFQQTHELSESSFFLKPFLGVTISTIAAVGIFFNQFIVMRLRDKIPVKDRETKDPDMVESENLPDAE